MIRSDNSLFKKFTEDMNKVLDENLETNHKQQRTLLEDLISCEIKFRDTLISVDSGKEMYRLFMKFILEDKKNILSSRVYFRERQDIFTAHISPAFQKEKHHLLYRFHVNYMFIKWVMDRYNGKKKKSLTHTFNKIIAIRKLLTENNMPLVLNRAKIFWSKVPNTHLDYMDIIQASCEGLMTAIDKYVPKNGGVFSAVAIGRMTLNMLTDHNATTIKFSPTERRILYRSNNAIYKEGAETEKDVFKYVKQSFKKTSMDQIRSIRNAANSLANIDEPVAVVGNVPITLKDTIEDDSYNQEEFTIIEDLRNKIAHELCFLPTLEMKILSMKTGILFKK